MGTTDLYRANRLSFVALGRTLNPAAAARTVPATPEWTVQDNFAHMAGVAADLLAGRLDGVATDPWTEVQVLARRGRSLDEVLDEWDELGPQVEAALAPMDDHVDPRLVIDMWTHEQDVRGLLGRPGGDADSLPWIVDRVLPGWVARAGAAGLPPLRVRAGAAAAGPEDAPVRLDLDPFDAARTVVGRRSVAQIRAFDWQGTADPADYVGALVVFTPAADDVVDARP